MRPIRYIFAYAIKQTPVCLLLFFVTFSVNAAVDTLSICLHYPQSSPVFDIRYRGNDHAITELSRIAASCDSVLSIAIVSSASPEGNTLFNQHLSELRSQTALSLVKNYCDSISVSSIGIDWNGLAAQLDSCDKLGSAQKASELIRITPEWIIEGGIITDSRKNRLRNLDNGRLWQYIHDCIFPELRVSKIKIVVFRKPKHYGDQSIRSSLVTQNYHSAPQTLSTPVALHIYNKHTACIALRTNMLLVAATVPNFGMEFVLRRNWSATLSGMYAWWSDADLGRYWRLQGVELTVRKYFGRSVLSGHHLGIYGQLLRYDFCLDGNGVLSSGSHTQFFNNPTLGIGTEYGYSFRICRRMRLDLSIGVGFLSGRYATYQIKNGLSFLTSTRNRRYLGPTHAEVSFVWLIGKGDSK